MSSVLDALAAAFDDHGDPAAAGPAVVDFDYWRERSMSVPSGFSDDEADRECDRAASRYQRFFDLDSAVQSSLASVLGSLA